MYSSVTDLFEHLVMYSSVTDLFELGQVSGDVL